MFEHETAAYESCSFVKLQMRDFLSPGIDMHLLYLSKPRPGAAIEPKTAFSSHGRRSGWAGVCGVEKKKLLFEASQSILKFTRQ